MSMFSSYVKRQIKKMGVKAFMIKVLETIAKITPGKKDDELVRKIKEVVNES